MTAKAQGVDRHATAPVQRCRQHRCFDLEIAPFARLRTGRWIGKRYRLPAVMMIAARQPPAKGLPARIGDVGAKITRPQIAKLFPSCIGCVLRDKAVIDALAGGIDRDVVAPRHRPAGEIVFALFLDRHGASRRFKPQALFRMRCAVQGQCARRCQPRVSRVGFDRGEGGAQRLPLLAATVFLFGAVAAGAEAEHFGIAGV